MQFPAMGKRWTPEDDEFLARWGAAAGYAFVASHDLGRSERAGQRRIVWLRKHKPELIQAMAQEQEKFEAKQRADFERGRSTGKWT